MHVFEKIVRALSLGLAMFCGAVLLLMMIQTAGDVVMRNVFQQPIKGNIEIISAYYMVFVVFLSLAIVELRHEHISVDLFVLMLPAGLRRVVQAVAYAVSAVFFAILAYRTFLDAVESWKINEIIIGAHYITIWPARFALPVGFFTVMLATLLHLWKTIADPDFDPAPHVPETMDNKRSGHDG